MKTPKWAAAIKIQALFRGFNYRLRMSRGLMQVKIEDDLGDDLDAELDFFNQSQDMEDEDDFVVPENNA